MHWKEQGILVSGLDVNMEEQLFTLLLRTQGPQQQFAGRYGSAFEAVHKSIVEGQGRIGEFQLKENKTNLKHLSSALALLRCY